jgi:hypothetical protein
MDGKRAYETENEGNKTIIMIINKLEEEIKSLMAEIDYYEFVKYEYDNYQYYTKLGTKYLVKCSDIEVAGEKFEAYQKIIKRISEECLKISRNDNNIRHFSKITKIVKKEEMIKTLKKIEKTNNADELLEVIKNGVDVKRLNDFIEK